MNPSSYDSSFSVYIHTSHSGKRYVGITSVPCENRWKHGGGYRYNSHFYRAINKYGWDNFTHEVVAQGLSLMDACDLETELISKYNTIDSNFGYNHTTCGNWGELSESTRQKIRGHSPWCTGLTKATDARLQHISERLHGRVVSETTRLKLSESSRHRFASGYSPIWITNGMNETYIDSSEPIPMGYHIGRLNNKNVYVHKDGTMKRVASVEVPDYLSNGWELGRGSQISSHISDGVRKYSWEYDGIMFNTSNDLAIYLNSHGYPNIVDSTITSLYIKGFEHSKKYKSLVGKIKKVNLR